MAMGDEPKTRGSPTIGSALCLFLAGGSTVAAAIFFVAGLDTALPLLALGMALALAGYL